MYINTHFFYFLKEQGEKMLSENKNLKGKVFIISAPSGAGKTSIVTKAVERLSIDIPISRVVTYTTRHPRPNEVNGVDYNFVSHQDFQAKAQAGFFLETTNYNDKLYGSPASILTDLELGKSFIFITDIEGVKSLSKLFEKPVSIWLNAPSFNELKKRIISRNTESAHQVEERLKLAEQEIKEAEKPRLFDYKIVNDKFEVTVEELVKLIKSLLEK
jgi:guanylate kinase